MGAACCIAVSDRTIHHEPIGDIVHRSFRHSPSWSFRRDSRVGVSGADTSIDVSAQASDNHSSLGSYQTRTWHKSPMNHKSAKNFRPSVSDQSVTRNASVEVKEESTQFSIPPYLEQSPSMHKTSSLCLSPLSSQSNPLPPSPARRHSFDINSPLEDRYTPYGMSVASNESTQGSYNKSLDSWTTRAFSESTSQKERCSFDSEPCSLTRVKLTKTYPTCGACSKLLSEKSPWSIQKFVAGNELSVISVLICGHVYHSECLESLTPEINKYDPVCPVCTFGEKQTLELTRKMLKAGKDLKARKSKKLKNQDGDTYGSFDFDYLKSSALDAKSPKLRTSSSLRISSAKPFLKQHFSFGSRGNKSASESPSIRTKGLF